jgi:WbqC-like protein family
MAPEIHCAPEAIGSPMRVGVLQSNYIPWRGYFDIIHDVDLFVFYDDVQYTVNDWRNRNCVKTANGIVWLTIPIGNQNDRRICDVEIRDRSWARKHWATIEQSYRRAAHFSRFRDFFREIYAEPWTSLSAFNQTLTRRLARECLDIQTEFRDSREYALSGSKADRLLGLLRTVGANEYVTGPSARQYLDPDAFAQSGVRVIWKDYSGYPEYPQLHGPFASRVSIVDTLMCCGDQSARYIWGYRNE